MSDHIYKLIELTGTSATSIEDAVQKAVERKPRKRAHNIRWFEYTETRGTIENGKISYWQVTIKIGFTLDE